MVVSYKLLVIIQCLRRRLLHGSLSLCPLVGVFGRQIQSYCPSVDSRHDRLGVLQGVGRIQRTVLLSECSYSGQRRYRQEGASGRWGTGNSGAELWSGETKLDHSPHNHNNFIFSLCLPPPGVAGHVSPQLSPSNAQYGCVIRSTISCVKPRCQKFLFRHCCLWGEGLHRLFLQTFTCFAFFLVPDLIWWRH